MADNADMSDRNIDATVEQGVAAARTGRVEPFSHLRPSGFCHWCGEPVGQGRLHCCPSADSCAEDHEKHLRFHGWVNGWGATDGQG